MEKPNGHKNSLNVKNPRSARSKNENLTENVHNSSEIPNSQGLIAFFPTPWVCSSCRKNLGPFKKMFFKLLRNWWDLCDFQWPPFGSLWSLQLAFSEVGCFITIKSRSQYLSELVSRAFLGQLGLILEQFEVKKCVF